LAALAGQTVVVPASAESGGQKVTGPVADYWMSASTVSGMGGMMGGGRRPSMAEIMGGGYGRGGSYTHSLILQLGSSQRPQGAPQAEHDPPQGLGAGPVLPLVTPTQQPSHVEAEPGPPPQYQQPHGRMLIFWGCGEHAPPGQPVVIDFAKIGPNGQGVSQMQAISRGLAVTPMQPPSPTRSATYGEWPNAQTRAEIPAGGSLQGAHTVRGDYTPEIHFNLTADQDFLPPIQLRTNAKNPSGSASLGWGAVDGAKGYFASMFGGGEGGDAVMWASSAAQASAFALPDYLGDREIERLVASHALMPASQTSCTVPVEAVRAARQGFFRLIAYGGETNLDYPPRPPAPKPWNIAWRVKVRYRAETSGLLGMSMPEMGGMGGMGQPGGDEDQDERENERQQQPPPRHGGFGGFGGLGGFIP
jgi:hypothetical protein